MVGGFLILIVKVFTLKNNMQTDVPVANVDVTFVCLDPFTGGKKDNAGMFTQVLVAILDELCPGSLGIIIEGKVNVMHNTHRSIAVNE
jgi:hypothetical protein